MFGIDNMFGASPMELAAAELHELFTALRGAGFTENQAFRILLTYIGTPQPPDLSVLFGGPDAS